MPKIFSEEKRLEIQERLMDTGLELIKQNGLKNLNIETVTKKVGIAQGTFYHFYKSKEVLVYHIANRYKEKVNQRMRQLLDTKGFLEREDIRSLYQSMFLKDEDNVYRYLKREDLQVLMMRLPKDYCINIFGIKEELKRNLQWVRSGKKEYDIDAIINWVQIMHLTLENKDILIEEAIEKNINRLIENMLDEIF